MLVQEIIKIENSKYSLYWMHRAFKPLTSKKIVSWTAVNPGPTVAKHAFIYLKILPLHSWIFITTETWEAMSTKKNLYINLFIVALYITVKNYEQPNAHQQEKEQTNLYSYTKYFSPIQRTIF